MSTLGDATSLGFAAALAAGRATAQPTVALVPVGSVEPHGPHLPLATDTIISQAAATRAVALLAAQQVQAWVAPAVPFGVTDCAAGFAGAISVDANALTTYLQAVAAGLRHAGFDLVCFVNNHLEPAHDGAVRAATGPGVVMACPLGKRWGRTLTAEFKSGQCHAGQYETSIVLAAAPTLVDVTAMQALPHVPVSLSDGLRSGKRTFVEMGMADAYAGTPAAASAAEGEATLALLATMVATETLDGLAALTPARAP